MRFPAPSLYSLCSSPSSSQTSKFYSLREMLLPSRTHIFDSPARIVSQVHRYPLTPTPPSA